MGEYMKMCILLVFNKIQAKKRLDTCDNLATLDSCQSKTLSPPVSRRNRLQSSISKYPEGVTALQ
jgi:hypothetical protein